MKSYRNIAAAVASLVIAASCANLDEIKPEGGTLLASQVESNPLSSEALFNGMYSQPGLPESVLGQSRADDFGFIMADISVDIEAADVVLPDSGYNWFSVCGELSSRSANYANPYIRYKAPYDIISICNGILGTYSADSENPEVRANVAQAKAMRAYAYLHLAPYFQFTYEIAKDKPCIPLIDENTVNFTDNPRATVEKVYKFIHDDLDYAVENLEGFQRSTKAKIDQQVAYGLRARVNLIMGNWAEAESDAAAAAEGYTPATIEEIQKHDVWFKDVDEHNWIWGYKMATAISQEAPYETSTSWIRSFSGDGYAPAVQSYAMINTLLYDKIPASDVRKGWWVNDKLESPLIDGLEWPGLEGGVALASDGGVSKQPYLPYTNVKFGVNKIGTVLNDEDWPYMRVEEMILIQAEALARQNKESDARAVLDGFVRTYRNPKYSSAASHCATLLDEIWFQRRVELWGEGFANIDTRRLNKPLVRFHDNTNNVPEAFRFNMTADDGWWLLRFPQSERNTNLAIIDNNEGTRPVQDQHPELLDGVTD